MDKFYIIKNTNNRYSINKNGLIKAHYKNVIMKQNIMNGYLSVQFNINKKIKTKRVHRLLAEQFISNPNNYSEINHKDGNKLNNNLSNLEWCTHQYNMRHASKNGLHGIKIKQILRNKTINIFNSMSDASRRTNINISNISEVIRGNRKTAGGYVWEKI
jgi:hypothetical protein